MKEKILTRFGKWLIKIGNLKICIVDDEEAYFNPQMLHLAAGAGFPNIERYQQIDDALLEDLQKNPRDILILDIKGIVAESIAKGGLSVASLLYKTTPTYIVITSAHKFYLNELHKDYDYVIESRLLTAIDFIEELEKILTDYLSRKKRFYQKLTVKAGYSVLQKAILPGKH